MPFEKNPVFEFECTDRRTPFRLKNTVSFHSKKGGEIVVVDEGFEFDGASIPKMFSPLVGCRHDERYLRAALVHDKLCISRELTWQRTHQIFKEILLESNVNIFRANLLYSAVFVGGPRWKIAK